MFIIFMCSNQDFIYKTRKKLKITIILYMYERDTHMVNTGINMLKPDHYNTNKWVFKLTLKKHCNVNEKLHGDKMLHLDFTLIHTYS